MKHSEYHYGWIHYKSVDPIARKSDLIGIDGEKIGDPIHEELRMYNASNKDPLATIKYNGKKYSFLMSKPPEPDPEPELLPGTLFWAPISEAEIKSCIAQALKDLKPKSRQQRRHIERGVRKDLKSKNIIRKVEEDGRKD